MTRGGWPGHCWPLPAAAAAPWVPVGAGPPPGHFRNQAEPGAEPGRAARADATRRRADLVGTDSPIDHAAASTHMNVRGHGEYGMASYEVLVAATRTPGAFLEEPIGQLLPGYYADLVIVDSNPLQRSSRRYPPTRRAPRTGSTTLTTSRNAPGVVASADHARIISRRGCGGCLLSWRQRTGRGFCAIAEGLTRDYIPSPSAHDPSRNGHRCGIAWNPGAPGLRLFTVEDSRAGSTFRCQPAVWAASKKARSRRVASVKKRRSGHEPTA
jgi:hypothetical protein